MSARRELDAPSWRRWLPWALSATAFLIVVAATGVQLNDQGSGFAAGLHPAMVLAPFVLASSYSFVGGLILRERPGHGMGRLLSWFGIAFAIGVFTDNYLFHEPALPARQWVLLWSGVGYFFFVIPLFTLTPLMFPTGRLPSPRWRLPLGVAGSGLALVVSGNLVDPAIHEDVGLSNPLGVPALEPWIGIITGLGMVPVAVLGLAALVDLVRRFRRSDGVLRLQMRWFAMGASIVSLSVVGLVLAYEVVSIELALVIFSVGAPALPASVAVAILRYRLYEIDRVVSRSVSYAVITVALAGLYLVAVVGLGALVRGVTGGAGGDLVVAASTLAVAAAFGPVRRRVQSAVDRRFARARYDAQLTVDAFGRRLRDEVDLRALTADLRAVVSTTVRPAVVSVWLAGKVSR